MTSESQNPYPRESRPERRQLTVVFCDLVDSTLLSRKLDPEDLRDILRDFQRTCTTIVKRYDGSVSRYMGDGIMILFGYPIAHEDDAIRSAHASLEIVEAMDALNARIDFDVPVPVRIRVGIATGLVVAGDLIGEGSSLEEAVVGETPNLAARLQGLAMPNSIVISAATLELLGDAFHSEFIGRHVLKGFQEPVPAWRLASRGKRDRFEAERRRLLTPMVDREEELSLITRLWGRAKAGEGWVLSLSGEAGIGKSRLTAVLRDHIQKESHRRLRLQCSPYYTHTALYPFTAQLIGAAGIKRDDNAPVKLEKLRHLLEIAAPDADEVLPLFAALLSIPYDSLGVTLDLSPARQKELTYEAMIEQIYGLARHKPLLMVIEDAHWMDPTSQDLLQMIIRRAREQQVFIVVTARPDFSPSWVGDANVTSLPIGRLSQHHCRDVVNRVTGGKAFPEGVMKRIVSKTDGVPLFIEELTKSMLNSNLLSEKSDRFELTGPLPEHAIPLTLQDSLMARLDQTGEAKAVALTAAAIGLEFPHELLAVLFESTGVGLDACLDRLVSSGLMFRRGMGSEIRYKFKHAMLRDVAYASLLRRRREELHRQIVDVLEHHFRSVVDEEPELLAHHCTEGRLLSKAITYWRLAGQRASARSENLEAESHLEHGIALVAKCENEAEHEYRELEMLVSLGPVLITNHGPGSSRVKQAYTRALQLCEEVPESQLHFMVHWGWWRISMDLRQAREWADRLLELAERQRDEILLLQAHHAQWATLFNLGELSQCLQHADQGITLYEQERHSAQANLYGGHDPGVCAHGEAALTLWLMGFPDQAQTRIKEAVRLAESIEHSASIAHALDYQVMLDFCLRDSKATQLSADRLHSLAVGKGFEHYAARALVLTGWAKSVNGDPHGALGAVREGIELQRETGVEDDFPIFLDVLSEVHELAGELEPARLALDEALSIAETSGMRHWLAGLYCRKGELLSTQGAAGDSEECLRTALHLAHEQGARAHELRAALDLARALKDRGSAGEVRELLEPVVASFTEGFDTIDFAAASELLATLK